MKKYFLTMAVMALFAIGFAASDEEESVNSENSEPKTEQKQESEAERKAREQKEEAERKANEQKEQQAKQDKILKEGYDRGYNDAMQYTYYQEMNYRIPYTNLYGAPKSDEEIALYKQYKEQYDKGWEEGKKVKAKMDE